MTNQTDYCDQLSVLDAIIEGRLTALDTTDGATGEALPVFRLAEQLGRLNRGLPAEFTPEEAELLYEVINYAVHFLTLDEEPTNVVEVVALLFMDLAFSVGEPFIWAINLKAVSDGSRIWVALPPEVGTPT